MDIRSLARSAAKAESARLMGKKYGRRSSWSAEEDDKVRKYYPDYRMLQKHLPGRSYDQLRSRARQLDVVRHWKPWLASEASRLRRLYPRLSRQELLAEFPEYSRARIQSKIKDEGLSRRRKFAPANHPLIDEIYQRAYELNYSLVDVDEMAATGNYFRKRNWLTHRSPNLTKIMKAIEALGGSIAIKFEDSSMEPRYYRVGIYRNSRGLRVVVFELNSLPGKI